MDYTWLLYLFLLLFQIITSRGEDLYCSTNNNITIKFTVDPPGNIIFWRRDGVDLRDVEVNAAGDDCAAPILQTPAGYEFDCKTVQNMSVYNLKFKSKIADNGIDFILSNISPTPTCSYTPYPLNTATPSHTNCGNFVDELKCKVECNCMKPSVSWKYVTEDQTEGNINITNINPVSCDSCGDNFYKLDINIKSSYIEKLLPTTVTGKVNITGILSIGDEKITLSTTINVKSTTPEPTTLQTSPSSSSVSSTQTSPFSSTSSIPQPSFSSSQPGQDTGDSSSTDTTPASTDTTPAPTNPVSTDTTPASTIPSTGTLTSTETIIIIVCCCVGVVILVVLVVCCVVVYIRRRGRSRKRDSIKYNNNSVPRSDLHTRYPYHHSPSGEVPRYTNRGYKPWNIYEDGYRYSKPTDRHTQYNNVYNRPYRYQREELYMKPDRMFYEPYQYYHY